MPEKHNPKPISDLPFASALEGWDPENTKEPGRLFLKATTPRPQERTPISRPKPSWPFHVSVHCVPGTRRDFGLVTPEGTATGSQASFTTVLLPAYSFPITSTQPEKGLPPLLCCKETVPKRSLSTLGV